MTPEIIVFTDGASRGNPGPAAVGVVVTDLLQHELVAFGKVIGEATNNQAEYRAVIEGLSAAAAHTKGSVEVRSDSELVVRQLAADYRTNDETLKALQAEVRRAEAPFAAVRYAWVPREVAGSRRADALANRALGRAR